MSNRMTRMARALVACGVVLAAFPSIPAVAGPERERCRVQPFSFTDDGPVETATLSNGTFVRWEANAQTTIACSDGSPHDGDRIGVWERAAAAWDMNNDGNFDIRARTAHRLFDMEQELNYSFRDGDGRGFRRCTYPICGVWIRVDAMGGHGEQLVLELAGTLDVQKEQWTSLEVPSGDIVWNDYSR